MAINLTSYVDNPFTEQAIFKKSEFEKHIRVAQRLSDDLVELELEAIERIIKKVEKDPEDDRTKATELTLWQEIKKKCQEGRRTGLGLTGMADFFAMLNVIYGSPKSLELVEEVYRTLRDEAYRESITLAQERGAFPVFNADLEKGNEYLNRLPENIRQLMKKHGRRNIGCLTTAPAGSVSIVAQVSNGFEPVFKAQYKRKRKINENDKEKPDFVDELGDKWKEYIVVHPGLKKFIEITGKTLEQSPYYGAQAEEIDYHMRIKMQAAATKYVDHAISSTVNLPFNIELEVVNELYMDAWESGCKGLTIFRADSRPGVLRSMDSTRECDDCDEAVRKLNELVKQGHRPSTIMMASAPTRPQTMECDIHRSKVGGGDWIFFVGKFNGRPYEVFGGDSEQFTIPNKYKTGWISKNGKINGVTQYNLILGSIDDNDEKLEFKGITKHFNNYEYGAFTRLTSLTMRHGTPIKYICEQITKKGVEGDLFSFQRAMARVLKKYIAEGEKSEAECPECHSTDVVYKNGCPTCIVCGHSNCA
jgi:ribonucleoside-diphosphate reductase alpha chain